MSDTTYDKFEHYGTNAQRLAFTPSPAAGIQPIYIWYETDTDNFYIFTTVWKGPYNTAGGGITIGSPVTISDANVKALPTTPQSLVAAPGAGFRLVHLFTDIKTNLASVYNNVDAAAEIVIKLGSSIISNSILNAVASSLTDVTSLLHVNTKSSVQFVTKNQAVLGDPARVLASDFENVALTIACTNGSSGNFTGGNGSNVFKVTPIYLVKAI